MNIEMNVSTTKNLGNEIKNCSNDLAQNIKRLYKVMDDIENSWQSQESSQFLEVMRNRNLSELEKLNEIIDEYGTYLIEIPEVYKVLDEIYRTKNVE